MSREAYQVPSFSTPAASSPAGASQQQASGGGGVGQYSTTGTSGGDELLSVTYICGDCSARIQMKQNDPIRCRECGHRVLYKERTRRMVQFQAR